jgi:hypothetical protein
MDLPVGAATLIPAKRGKAMPEPTDLPVGREYSIEPTDLPVGSDTISG